jgi:hypothetical protein
MGGVDNIAQRKWGNNPFSSAVTRAGRVALQAGCDIYLLGRCERCPVWGNLRMLLPSCFSSFLRFIRESELTSLRVNKSMASGAASPYFVQNWKLDRR